MAGRVHAGSIEPMNENTIVTDTTTSTPPFTQDDASVPPATGTTPRLFRRSRTDRMLGGVCGGLSKALNVDVTLLRVALVAATLLGFGTAAIIYLVCWIAVPEDDAIA
jgi:phage shock protein C